MFRWAWVKRKLRNIPLDTEGEQSTRNYVKTTLLFYEGEVPSSPSVSTSSSDSHNCPAAQIRSRVGCVSVIACVYVCVCLCVNKNL